MSRSNAYDFHLESDDRTKEERLRRAGLEREAPRAPMDTDYQEEMEKLKPAIRFNLNFDREFQGMKQDAQAQNATFTIERLFEAVASRDVSRLDGLEDYLKNSRKKLSDSLYQSHGKSALMKALLHLKDGKNETVEKLLEISERTFDIEKFVNAAYTSPHYKGQTALHIAIERRSLFYVQLLVSKGADVHAKACGKFFQPHDGPYFYFGELPLSLAACTKQPEMVDFLMHQGADPKLQDSQGNTVLHALVVVAADDCEENVRFITRMYDRILKTAASLKPKTKLENIENNEGLTPLKLAAKRGKIGIFSHILTREFHESHTKHLSRKFTEWVYGPLHCSLYDLASVDSYEKNSVLEIMVYGTSIPNRHKMLQTELLSQLLDQKWRKFAGHIFCIKFVVYLLYLVLFTVIGYNKKSDLPPFPIEDNLTDYLYCGGQVLLLLANCYFFIIGIVDMKRKRPKLKTLLVDGYYEILFFLQGILYLVSTGLYFGGHKEYLEFVVLCLAFSWVNVLYYSRGNKQMGIYSIMIQKMILSDILRFLFVYLVFLFGFSAAVVTLLIEPPPKNTTGKTRFIVVEPGVECTKPSYRNIPYTTLQLFKFTIGMGDMEFTQEYQYKEIFYVLLIGYIILTYILLLNMLIALMNRTVEQITQESASIWNLQRAVTILDMERSLPFCLQKKFRCGVKKRLCTAAGDDERWCFRVEEVNWNKWNIDLGKLDEDPEYCDGIQMHVTESSPRRPNRGRSWRDLFTASRRLQTNESTEMSTFTV